MPPTTIGGVVSNTATGAGITKTGFALHGPELWRQGGQGSPHTSFGSVANRVSYLLNLRGPSMPMYATGLRSNDRILRRQLAVGNEAADRVRGILVPREVAA